MSDITLGLIIAVLTASLTAIFLYIFVQWQEKKKT